MIKYTFEAYFVPRKKYNICKSARFNQTLQQANKTLDSFITAFYALAENCSDFIMSYSEFAS